MNIDLNKHIYPIFRKMFRSQRMEKFIKAFNLDTNSKILDVGGYPDNWLLSPILPDVMLLNLKKPKSNDKRFKYIVADGTSLPFKNGCIEIVYSNSVIEHLGNLENQRIFANEVKRVSKNYYIQTPNKYFPVEPHFLTFILHWFPKKIQTKLLKYFSLRGFVSYSDGKTIDLLISELNLLTKKELEGLFEGCNIWFERVLGFSKSLIAVSRTNKS